MLTTYLLDTDIAIELLRSRNVHVAAQLASRDRNTRSFSRLCLDREAGERSGLIRADLERRGERIGAYDVLIAGIALVHGHVLATHNVREFGRLEGLQIEDWAATP